MRQQAAAAAARLAALTVLHQREQGGVLPTNKRLRLGSEYAVIVARRRPRHQGRGFVGGHHTQAPPARRRVLDDHGG